VRGRPGRATRWAAAAAGAVAVLVGPLASTAAAQAVAACEAVVGDVADRLTPEAQQAVLEAAASLGSDTIGTVRVRLLGSVDGDLDGWATSELGRCPAWNTAGGGARGTFLLLAVALDDRLTGTYYGSDLVPVLDPVRSQVHESAMAPLLREGDVAGALVAGLDAYRSVLVAQEPEAVEEPTVPAPPTAGAAPRSDPTEVAPTPADGGGVVLEADPVSTPTPWPLLLGAGGLLAAVGCAALAGRRRRVRAAVAEVRAVAEEVTGRLDATQRTWLAGAADRRSALALVAAGDRAATALVREQDEADAALALARDAVLRAPTLDGLREVEAARAALAPWAAAREHVDAAVDEVAQAVAAAGALVAAIGDAPRRIDAAAAAVDAARSAIGDAQDAGYRTDGPSAAVERAETALTRARACTDENRPGDAADLADRACEHAEAARAEAAGLPAVREDLLTRTEALRTRAADLEAARTAAAEALAVLRAGWARTAWEELADVPDDAARELRELRAVPFRVEADAAMTVQRFAVAGQALAAAEARAEGLAAALAAVPDRLEAVRAADEELERARGRTEAAADAAHDVLQRRGSLLSATGRAAVEAQVEELRDLLAEVDTTPRDPLRLTTLLHRAERTLAAGTRDARAEADRTAAARRRATEAIADAERAVQRATGWFRILPEPRLARAEELLTRARGAVTSAPEAAAADAAQAELLAEQVRAERHHHGGGGFGSGFGASSLGSSTGPSGGSWSAGSGGSSGGGWGGGGSSGW
jgi:uncharacterized membrane protein YgcG